MPSPARSHAAPATVRPPATAVTAPEHPLALAPGTSPDDAYEAFEAYAAGRGVTLYPHQEEAALAILGGEHVVLATPTGSGKSLVAIAAHAAALARGARTFYTAPVKALVSEKFFDLAATFGAANVGMVTGDIAINPGAPIICCTAEILAAQTLRGQLGATPANTENDADLVVVADEFHFYADPQRGSAWQIPLLDLPGAQFVLLSATLGDMSAITRDLTRRTGRECQMITHAQRPVPLTFTYSLQPLTEVIEELLTTQRAPVYVVHFTQAAALERAQALTSVQVTSRPQREAIAQALTGERFARGFGQTLSRLLRLGIGVHHAGMLPRYRRLVERLVQAGHLRVVCGTDTLGVGVNMPIRTVVFTGLTKFDGVRQRHLSAREFHQIAGRAGRAGFDTVGDVVVQAPEHVIENAKALAKAGDDERKRRKIVRKKAPEGQVNWTDKTFERLREAEPEALTSQFHVTHAMVLGVLARPGDPVARMSALISGSHEPERAADPHVRRAIGIYRSLRSAGLVQHTPRQYVTGGGPTVTLETDVPDEFALNSPLAPFALAAMELLDPEAEPFTRALEVVSVIEATTPGPRPVLMAQQHAARGEAIGTMKADGLEYDERMELLEEVTYPQPLAELLAGAFEIYARANPWAAESELEPKSVVREMIETGMTFSELVSRYSVARSEGVVLRYLTDVLRSMRQIVPAEMRTDEVEDVLTWLGELVRQVDSSLLSEWEALSGAASDAVDADGLTDAELEAAERRFGDAETPPPFTANERAFRTAVRGAAFRRVELLAREQYAALGALDGDAGWDPQRWADALGPYWTEYDEIGTDGAARSASLLLVEPEGRTWYVTQILADPDGDRDWRLVLEVDLDACDDLGEVVVRPVSLGPL
ncbi:DEAD/DEAH box helicase [Litorihabitans aurantiacus]|uniref:DEAD/DEAH box helicase n=1 Tax=Litorihabitans aurantiacus TaxID=1930061 RepID=UPI003D672D75